MALQEILSLRFLKAKKMDDVQDDAYKTMLCIETANALADAKYLASGEEHTLQCCFNRENRD